MAFDEGLAQRIREVLLDNPNIDEKKMFGGLSFLLLGNMSCGVIKDELIVRVGPDLFDTWIEKPHARPFDFTGKPMNGWITVSSEGLTEDQELREWVSLGVEFASSLPPK
jgi:TfoX/Sxy family transcriptional regulator of competence genes